MLEDKANTFKVGKIILKYKPKLERKPEAKKGIRKAYDIYNIYNL